MKKTFLKSLKLSLFILLIGIFLVLCGFYTHPTFMENQVSKIWPSFKQSKLNQSLQFDKYFQSKCTEYRYISNELNDKYRDYIWNSAYQKFGEIIKKKNEIRSYYLQEKLFLVDSSDWYVVDTLFHSYAFLTKDAKTLLEDIGQRFQYKLKNTNLNNCRILVTSMLRTESSVKRLMKKNRNSLRISSHLHGTTFDLAHNEFVAQHTLKAAEIEYLKEILAETLSELRKEERCFVTYEINQACFHVVNKKIQTNS